MPDIALANVTVTLPPLTRYNPPGQPNISYPQVTFGNGTLTYPTGGIPLPPAPAVFGFLKAIIFVTIMATTDAYNYVYDTVNNTIRIFNKTGAELTGGSSQPAATTLYLKAEGE